jgi:hypothetical protein
MTKFLANLIPILLALNFVICEENFVTPSDSYLEALRESKGWIVIGLEWFQIYN